MKIYQAFTFFFALILSCPFSVNADVDNTDLPAAERPIYGVYEELTRIPDYVTDVRYDADGKVWIKLGQLAQNKELKVRLRNSINGPLRRWEDGSDSLVADAYRGTAIGIWSDWVRVSANYIEYWIDDTLVLQLHRIN